MLKTRLYLDSSVPSAFFDERVSDRKELTIEFWNHRLPDYAPMISDVVLLEIEQTSNAKRKKEILELVAPLEKVKVTLEARNLAAEYVKKGVFPAEYEADALHCAIATIERCVYLASWNFTHLVKVKTRKEVSLTNSIMGYSGIEIVVPPEL